MIIAVPPKTLTASQKDKLNKKGYIIIETEDPDKIRVIVPEQPIATNSMLMGALHAISGNDYHSGRFVLELYKRLKAEETADINKTQNPIPHDTPGK